MWVITNGFIMREIFFNFLICTQILSTVYSWHVQDQNIVNLIKFKFSEKEKIIELVWSNNKTAEVQLEQEDKECIYRGKFKEEIGSSILVTGCKHRMRSIQIQSILYGETLGEESTAGTIVPVMGETKAHYEAENENSFNKFGGKVGPKRKKREAVDNLNFYLQYPDTDEFSLNPDFPSSLFLPLRIYLSPSWNKKFGGFKRGKSKAKEVLSHVRDWFRHKSLNTKFQIIYKDNEFYESEADLAPTQENLIILGRSVSAPTTGRSAIVYLTANNNGKINGIANSIAICDEDRKLARSMTNWDMSDSTIRTAQTLAHEIGHNLGFYHDFYMAKTGRTVTCGPGQWEGGPDNKLMNYMDPIQSEWSKCSNEDFKNYYSRVIAKKEFCLHRGEIKCW